MYTHSLPILVAALALLVACGGDDTSPATTASSGTGGASSGTGGASSGIGGASSGTGGASSGIGGASSGIGGGLIPPGPTDGIWISPQEVMLLDTSGPAWDALLADAQSDAGIPDLSDQEQDNNVLIMAKALVCTRLSDDAMCDEVRQAVMAIPETENGGTALAISRELMAYVIAADLVGLDPADDASFRAWLSAVRYEDLSGRSLVSTHEDRPNNWGTHAGASRVAAAIYLGEDAEVEACAQVFEGYLGNRSVYAGFSYGELSWQLDEQNPVGINPAGATKEGHNIDGVLPDDQRRGGSFSWPPPQENYVWEALQGALAQAVILYRRGYDVFNWEDQALLRAVEWLHTEPDYPAEGDDEWLPHIINHYYPAASYPAAVPARTGKNAGYTDWTHPPP